MIRRCLPLALFVLAGCADDVPPTLQPPASPTRSAVVGDPLAEVAARGDTFVSVLVRFQHLRKADDLLHMVEDHNLQVENIYHAFRYQGDVQIGGFAVEGLRSPREAFADFELSESEFLRTAVEHTRLAEQDSKDPVLKRARGFTQASFRARLAHFRGRGPAIYALRVRGAARDLLALREGDGQVGAMVICAPERDPTDCTEPTDPPADETAPPPDQFQDPGYTDPSWDMHPSYNILPGETAPSQDADYDPSYSYYPDPTDQSTSDDNSKDHRSWNPSRGRSYVDQDGYGRYTMQYILFANGRASLFKNNRGTYTFELETHQDGRDGLPYYGVKHLTDSRGNKTRGHTWQANWPKGVYLDAQAGTDVFDKTITHAIGTTRPDSFAYNREYYYYIRYSRESSGSWDQVQIGTELGRRLGGCDGSAFCVYTKDNYVRPLPYMCGYKAPNRNHVAYNSSYRDWRKTWSWDGWGYKNEKCTS
jgi:hypothetical protein